MTGKADVSVRLWGSNSLTAILSQPRHSEVVDDTIHLSFPGGLQLWNLKNEKRHLETHIYKGPLGNTLVVCRLVSLWSLLPKKAALWSCLSMRWVAPSPWLQSEKHGSSPRCHQRQKWRCACWSLDDFSQKGSLSTHGLKNPPGLLVSFLRFFFYRGCYYYKLKKTPEHIFPMGFGGPKVGDGFISNGLKPTNQRLHLLVSFCILKLEIQTKSVHEAK